MTSLQRLQIIGSWALHSMRFHTTRTLLTVLAVALSTALVVSTVSVYSGYRRSLEHNIRSMGYQVLVTGKGCPHEAATLILRGGSIPMYIREDIYQTIVRMPEVQDSTRFFMQSAPRPEGDAYQLYVGIDDGFLRLRPGVTFQRGEWFTSPTADEVILGFNVAEYLRLNIGDTIEVNGSPFEVHGILDKLGTQDDGTVFLPLLTSQTLFERRDRLTGVGLRLHDPNQAGPLIEKIYDIPSVQVVRMEAVQSTILNILNGVHRLLLGFCGLSLLLVLSGVFNSALIAAHERRGEMGVLRALGCPAGTLFKLVWSESLLVGAAGVALGALLGFLLGDLVEWVLRATMVFVPAGPVVVITLPVLLGSCATVIALCLAASAYPAWRSSMVSPMCSIRGEV
jgi:ABC-type lipoprotein release transport system permease subunit